MELNAIRNAWKCVAIEMMGRSRFPGSSFSKITCNARLEALKRATSSSNHWPCFIFSKVERYVYSFQSPVEKVDEKKGGQMHSLLRSRFLFPERRIVPSVLLFFRLSIVNK